MSSETDHPRQRTVAELLAEHGDTGATGRRRRRREDDGPGEDASVPPPANGTGSSTPAWQSAPPEERDRSVLRERVPDGSPPRNRRRQPEPDERQPWEAQPERQREPAAWDARPQGSAARESPQRDPRTREPQPWEAQPSEAPYRDARSGATAYRDTPSAATAYRDAPSAATPYRDAPSGATAYREPASGAAAYRDAPRGGPDTARPPARGFDAAPAAAPLAGRPPAEQVREHATEQMPRVRGAAPADPGLTTPIQQTPPRDVEYDDPAPAPDDDGGPPTMMGAAPVGAESWHRARTVGRRPAPVDDGPPTQASTPLDFDDHPAGLAGGDPEDEPHGYGDYYSDDDDEFDDDAPATKDSPSRRMGRAVADTAGQAWAAVLAQWIAGAIGGAALWVGFRFLWRSLPVVALAAAVLVTVGLVVVVRALLRNDDMRTTVFAVLVGLLLTVSPAILVLLGR